MVVLMIFSGSSGKSPVMPIRRAAATPTQEKTPSAAAEKGKGEVALHLHPVKPWPRPLASHQPHVSQCSTLTNLYIHSLNTERTKFISRIFSSSIY